MHFVYILKCSDGSYYTGYTTDVERRVKEHNEGKGSKSVRGRLPAMLVHKESFRSKSRALKREAEIKSWSHDEKESLVKD